MHPLFSIFRAQEIVGFICFWNLVFWQTLIYFNPDFKVLVNCSLAEIIIFVRFGMFFGRIRSLGPAIASAAITSPRPFRTGTAMDVNIFIKFIN